MGKRFTTIEKSRLPFDRGGIGPGRFRALLLALLGLTVACGVAGRPNVILIITDDQSPRNPPTPEYPNLVFPPGFGCRVLNTDYAATILDLADVKVPADLKARLGKHLLTFPNRPFGEFTR